MSVKDWLLADIRPQAAHSTPEPEHEWWRVMCLTGVDYFSTLGYQPGIAFLAAGVLSPVATFVLVLVTLLGALPVYRRVAEASPNGQGSIHMLESLFSHWKGKSVVLILLGFAATDFIITMTLSAADAATHFVHNPITPPAMHSQMGVTLVILGLLGAVFLAGFREAIGIAVVLVGAYLALNAVVVAVALWHVFGHPELIAGWNHALLFKAHGNPMVILGISLILFPKLALGLSGFETGVAVMPLVKGKDLKERIQNTRKLLTTAAIIMSVFLMATSVVSTLLIPAGAFERHGPANGRAMAYLAHQYLGNAFGSVYDASTILILAFAGASAMAGLLNLIPRYLPGFGMAPEWALASRPLSLVFTGVAFTVTWLFRADVDAQGGAYATGVLVLITSGAFAVTLAAKSWMRLPFGFISLLFVYTTLLNIYERPEGVKIASFFIASIVLVSLISRAVRSTELRITGIHLDDTANDMICEDPDGIIRIVARNPQNNWPGALDVADARVRELHNLSPEECLLFFEVERSDASTFEATLSVHGRRDGPHKVLYASSPVVANSIAALLIEVEKRTGHVPHAYFSWTEGNPVANIIRYVFLGEGDVAPLTHEVLRRAVRDPRRCPIVHVS
jgi:hypothetical protein